MVVQMLRQQSQRALLRQTGIGVCVWGVRSWLGSDTSTGSDFTPHGLLNNLLTQTAYGRAPARFAFLVPPFTGRGSERARSVGVFLGKTVNFRSTFRARGAHNPCCNSAQSWVFQTVGRGFESRQPRACQSLKTPCKMGFLGLLSSERPLAQVVDSGLFRHALRHK